MRWRRDPRVAVGVRRRCVVVGACRRAGSRVGSDAAPPARGAVDGDQRRDDDLDGRRRVALVVDVVGAVRAPGVVRARGGRAGDRRDRGRGRRDRRRRPRSASTSRRRSPTAQRVAVPRVGEPPPASIPAVSGDAPTRRATGDDRAGPVNLNTATADAARGAAGHRADARGARSSPSANATGRFESVDDLSSVRGHRREALRRLRDLVTRVIRAPTRVRSSRLGGLDRGHPRRASASGRDRAGRAAGRRRRRARGRVVRRRPGRASWSRPSRCALLGARVDGSARSTASSALAARRPRSRAATRRDAARATLVDDPDAAGFGTDARAACGSSAAATARRAWSATRRRRGCGSRVLDAGDRVVARAAGSRRCTDDRFDAGARWRHAVGRARRRARCSRSRRPAARSCGVANRLRDVVLRGHATAPARRRARCSPASCSATRAAFPTTSSTTTATAGLSHLLAVSGENVAFVLALVGPLLRRLCARRRARRSRSAIVVGVRDDDALRAVGAARVGDGGGRAARRRSSGRPASRLRALALAVIALLARRSVPRCTRSGSCCRAARASGSRSFAAPIAARLPGSGVGARAARGVARGASSASRRCCSLMFGDGARSVTPLANLVAGARGRGARRVRAARERGRRASCRRSAPRAAAADSALLVALGHASSPGAAPRSASTLDGGGAIARSRSAPRWRVAYASLAVPGASRSRPCDSVTDVIDVARAHARDGHPQPHARLVLRPRRDLGVRRVPRGAPRSSSPTAPTCSTSAA